MNINIYCMHNIIKEDNWRPQRAASNYLFFSKKADIQTHKHTHRRRRRRRPFSSSQRPDLLRSSFANLVFWGPRSFQFDLEININIYYMHYIIREDYWRPQRAASNYLFFSKKTDTHTNTHTHKQTNRLGQKTPLIKVSYSKQRPKVKHFLGIFYPIYCILCIFPLLRFQIGAKLEISQNCRWKIFVSQDLNLSCLLYQSSFSNNFPIALSAY